MILLTRLWRFWADSWSSARDARLLYAAVTIAFAGLMVAAAVMGEATVAVIAGLVALATAGLTAIAPRLAGRTPRREERM